jgi:glycolate oxidase FAD binding subunit
MTSRLLPEAALADLEGLIGSHNVFEDPYVRVGGKRAAAEVVVSDPESLVDVMRIATESRLTVFPVGGGTKMGWGASPTECDLLVRIGRRPLVPPGAGSLDSVSAALGRDGGPLTAILEYDPDNLTITAGAGIPVAEVAEFVAQDGLVLPMDPAGAGVATIGGVLSTNDHGPHRLSRGGNRDVVLGVGAVLIDGERVKAGGRTIKNVTGYDLTRLFVGSLGTLGVITEATIRLLPRQPSEQVLVYPHRDLEGAAAFVRGLLSKQLLPAAVEVLSPAAGRLAEEQALGIVGTGGYTVVAAFEGQEAAVARQIRDVVELAGADTGIVLAVERPIDTLWAVLNRLRDAGRRAGYSVEAKISVPRASLWDVLAMVESSAECDLVWTAGAGVGTAHMSLGSLEKLGATPTELIPPLLAARTAAEDAGGSLVVTEGSHVLAPDVGAWGTEPGGVQVMRAMKAKFDPWGLLNPGRFVGGI